MKTINTSKSDWMKLYAKQMDKKESFKLNDDAGIGVDPRKETMIEMGEKAELGFSDWTAVLISLGVSGAGLWMIRLACIDPEPTSKLMLLFMSGVVLVGLGGINAIRILTKVKPLGCKVRKRDGGFEVEFA